MTAESLLGSFLTLQKTTEMEGQEGWERKKKRTEGREKLMRTSIKEVDLVVP